MINKTLTFYILDDGVEFSYSVGGTDEFERAQIYLRKALSITTSNSPVTTFAITSAQYMSFKKFMADLQSGASGGLPSDTLPRP